MHPVKLLLPLVLLCIFLCVSCGHDPAVENPTSPAAGDDNEKRGTIPPGPSYCDQMMHSILNESWVEMTFTVALSGGTVTRTPEGWPAEYQFQVHIAPDDTTWREEGRAEEWTFTIRVSDARHPVGWVTPPNHASLMQFDNFPLIDSRIPVYLSFCPAPWVDLDLLGNKLEFVEIVGFHCETADEYEEEFDDPDNRATNPQITVEIVHKPDAWGTRAIRPPEEGDD